MKKKLLKGEISTIITLGTLIFLGVSSLASVVFLRKTQTTKTRAAGCAKVENVSYSGDVAAGKTFTCLAVTNGASPRTMACGISKNGGWPYGMQSGSCSGKNCTFSVKMDDQIEAGAVYQLVAFDFRTECGPDKGNRTQLNVQGAQPQPTQANCDEGCCGMPDGFIYKRAIKASCDSNYKGGRYVIIDGVCQGGKKTEKPGCATCRPCQTEAKDIAPVPDADLAVNECNSSCEQKEGGNPTPNPNSSTPKQTITPNPNPGGKPPNIPPPINPPPAGITPQGGKDQPCKVGLRYVNEVHEIRFNYCDGNLVCSKEYPEKGICVEPKGGEGQSCRVGFESGRGTYYHCDAGLLCVENKCVKPTSTPAPTSPPGTTSAPAPTLTEAAKLTQAAASNLKSPCENIFRDENYCIETRARIKKYEESLKCQNANGEWKTMRRVGKLTEPCVYTSNNSPIPALKGTREFNITRSNDDGICLYNLILNNETLSCHEDIDCDSFCNIQESSYNITIRFEPSFFNKIFPSIDGGYDHDVTWFKITKINFMGNISTYDNKLYKEYEFYKKEGLNFYFSVTTNSLKEYFYNISNPPHIYIEVSYQRCKNGDCYSNSFALPQANLSHEDLSLVFR